MPAKYTVTIFSGDATNKSSFHNVFLTLVGKDWESDRIELSRWPFSFWSKNVSKFDIDCPKALGELLMIRLEKVHQWVVDTNWFLAKVEVESPIGDIFHFPINKWITDCKVHYFREGKAVLPSEDNNPETKKYRKQELLENQQAYCWDNNEHGLPHGMKADCRSSLPADEHFHIEKKIEGVYTLLKAYGELGLIELIDWLKGKTTWTNIEDIDQLYHRHRTTISDYVHDHWKDDAFFGYQFLNGVNPMLIQCCSQHSNLPVSEDMVLPDGQRLKDEIKNGKVFLCDYKILKDVKTNVIDGKQQYLAAPLVLLHKTPDDKLMPFAIQLGQNPSEDNPVFFPSDSTWDWLLAKTFVRSADFNLHELNAHLLRTHLLAEVFAVSLMRNLPMVHPLYKLLRPHTRDTLMINFLARKRLISKDGILTKFASSGGEGMFTILQRSLSSLTYRSLCLPDDIADRGLEDVPNFYYRDDGQKLWDIIYRLVEGILRYYYTNDKLVKEDNEVQSWIGEIFKEGFLSIKKTEMPEEMNTVDELIKFVTMVIFTCSAQHSAVNTGQYDFAGWMPNTPVSLKLPPPTAKGTATEVTVLEAFPDIYTTVNGMATVWLLSRHFSDSVFLGNRPEENFTEEIPLQKIKVFKEELEKLSEEINERNKDLPLPYVYLDPKVVENSVSI